MAHHVKMGEVEEFDSLDSLKDLLDLFEPGLFPGGQIHLGDITGDYRLRAETQPRENIFICSWVVFCASSG